MKTKKSAVAPVNPVVVTATWSPIPKDPPAWQTAFNELVENLFAVVEMQTTAIVNLRTELKTVRTEVEDARGVAAAVDKQLAAALDVQDRTMKATATVVAGIAIRIEDIAGELAAAVKGHTDTATALAALGGNVAALASIVDQCAELAAIVGIDGGGLVKRADTLADRVDTLVDRVEAVASDAEAVDKRIEKAEAVAGDVGRQGIATAARLDEMRVSLDALGATVDDLSKTASEQDGELQTSLDEVGEAVRAVEQRVMELQGVAGRHSVALDDAGAAIGANGTTLDLFGERLTDAVGVVDTLTKARAVDVEWFRGVEARAVEAQDLAGATAETLAEETRRLSMVQETVEGFVATATNIGRDVAGAVAAVERFDQQISDALRRVTISLGEMPAGFMIDQDGILNRVNRAGDLTAIGRVVGEAKNGRDAPVIVAAKIENDRLIITMSDRTEITAAIPRAVEPIAPAVVEPIDPTTLGYLSKDPNIRIAQTDDMKKMRAAGKGYKEIAAKYGISERHVVRLINGTAK